VLVIVRELIDKGVGNGAALTLAFDVSGYLGDVSASGRPVNQARYLGRGSLVKTSKVIASIAAHARGIRGGSSVLLLQTLAEFGECSDSQGTDSRPGGPNDNRRAASRFASASRSGERPFIRA